MKKIFIILTVFLLSLNIVLAGEEQAAEKLGESSKKYRDAKKEYNQKLDEKMEYERKKGTSTYDEKKAEKLNSEADFLKTKSDIYEEAVQDAKNEYKTAHKEACKNSGNCLETPEYMVNVSEIAPVKPINGGSIEATADNIFEKIINVLMVGIGILSVLVMIIGGGFMILNGGNDETLNKGKTIFKAGILSVVLALSSYIIVKTILNLIYS